MKKFLLIAAIAVCGMFSANAQDAKFGAKVGYTNITAKADYGEGSVSVSESGFYIGALADFTVNESFHVQPEINYANVEETNFLYIPVLAKYYISESGFQLMAGPQANFILDSFEGENSFGLDLTFGAAYDIDEHFFIEARYSFELTNRIEDGGDYDVSGKYNTLFVGIGYKF